MKRLVILFTSVLLLTLFVAGCATIVTGHKKLVTVNSTPSKAKVKIRTLGGLEVANGTTPYEKSLNAKSDYIVRVELSGYEPVEVTLTRQFNMWVIGNLICGGIPGLIIDFLSGAINTLDPQDIMVTLESMQTGMGEEEIVVAFYALDDSGEVVRYYTPMTPVLPIGESQ